MPEGSAGAAREHEHDQAQVVREHLGSLRSAAKRAAIARRKRRRREPESVRGICAHVGSARGSHYTGIDPRVNAAAQRLGGD